MANTPPGMCLLHADFHPMGQDCWQTCTDWYLAHTELPEQDRRDRYQWEVERAILDQHIRALNPTLTLAV
ncbi:hypothetical protein PV382_23855 [Streptomyces scabiei]|uniref:hypothetical protein n=1 Tax=Streptomyces scabiei TaxID=1930 RepID=UPI000765AF10|nr:hypothetical protein [Streptomyces scabiei]MDX2658322.1 hypothetical protein [Streptomyces scabiei]MDX2870607.1 hypothetical protein [Streptomyces scabiei]MDX2999538.1 hypothetical protein [Streptomyces scabiei]MDX3053002.1 hypothetical protein [Streptomyces scabiei]MDX3175288.1 hypothetical protein [Streptomyces scabiei]